MQVLKISEDKREAETDMFKRKYWEWTLAGVLVSASLAAQADQIFQSDKTDFRLETVAAGLEHPWDIAFLPDGSALITEREGRLRILEDGQLRGEPIEGLPELVVSGQGGLLDVLLHPDFENNRVLLDRKSTRLNSSHVKISYAVFCLKKKKRKT